MIGKLLWAGCFLFLVSTIGSVWATSFEPHDEEVARLFKEPVVRRYLAERNQVRRRLVEIDKLHLKRMATLESQMAQLRSTPQFVSLENEWLKAQKDYERFQELRTRYKALKFKMIDQAYASNLAVAKYRHLVFGDYFEPVQSGVVGSHLPEKGVEKPYVPMVYRDRYNKVQTIAEGMIRKKQEAYDRSIRTLMKTIEDLEYYQRSLKKDILQRLRDEFGFHDHEKYPASKDPITLEAQLEYRRIQANISLFQEELIEFKGQGKQVLENQIREILLKRDRILKRILNQKQFNHGPVNKAMGTARLPGKAPAKHAFRFQKAAGAAPFVGLALVISQYWDMIWDHDSEGQKVPDGI